MLSACAILPFQKLHSTTSIKAHDAFILGNNEHGKFGVKLGGKLGGKFGGKLGGKLGGKFG